MGSDCEPDRVRSITDTTIGRVSCKKMQGNESKPPCISFYFLCRIWTFQWVMANSNKKNRRTLNSPLGLCSAQDPGRHICARFSASRSAPYSVGEKMLSHISIYAKIMQALAVLAVGARERGAWGRTAVAKEGVGSARGTATGRRPTANADESPM